MKGKINEDHECRIVPAPFAAGGQPRAFAQRRVSDRRLAVMVKVSADEDIVGWGRCGAPGQESVKTVLDLEMTHLLIRRDSFLIEQL